MVEHHGSNPPKHNPSERMDRVPPGLGVMGMWLFIVSLSMLFLSTLFGYFYVRYSHPVWKSAQLPGLPDWLWISSFILIMSSYTHQRALNGIRRNEPDTLRSGMLCTLILAVSFLISQVVTWYVFIHTHLPSTERNLYTFTFYMLTGLHAVHVLGGLVPIGIVTVKAYRGRYTQHRYEGVVHSVMYWHFLGVVWMMLFLTLKLA